MGVKQHQDHLLSLLSSSIEVVYNAFDSYPIKEFIEYCPHCHGEEEERHLHKVPLNEMTPGNLGQYAFNALSIWGDSADYRHFLPRILELSVSRHSEPGLEPWLIGSKLAYAKWDSWPSLERNAILGFMEAAWQIVLSCPPSDASKEIKGPIWWSVEETFALVANSGIDVDPFLKRWLPSDELSPHLHLALLSIDQAPYYSKKKSFNLPIITSQTTNTKLINWLLNMDIYESLMNIYEEEINSDWSDLLAQGVDALEWIHQVK